MSVPRNSIVALSFRLLVFGAAIPLVFSGCATLTKGSDQTITVTTDPSGATCTISREGKTVAVVNPTPGGEAAAGKSRVVGRMQSTGTGPDPD